MEGYFAIQYGNEGFWTVGPEKKHARYRFNSMQASGSRSNNNLNLSVTIDGDTLTFGVAGGGDENAVYHVTFEKPKPVKPIELVDFIHPRDYTG